MSDDIRDVIAAQAARAINKEKWAQLRYIGNRFERARCYRDCWQALHEQLKRPPFTDSDLEPNVTCSGALVLPNTRDLGDELRILRFIAIKRTHRARDRLNRSSSSSPVERSFPGVICCSKDSEPC